MVGRYLRAWIAPALSLLLGLSSLSAPLAATSGFASPLFQAQWQRGEAVTPNFWGPLANATDGMHEPYTEAPGGQRLVQYFDKARMELTNPTTGAVTNGLLTVELVTGKRQLGNDTFQQVSPAGIAVAGDPTNAGPTYAQVGVSGLRITAASAIGQPTTRSLSATGTAGTFAQGGGDANATIDAFDATTGHNVPKTFADYRTTAGLLTIGLAIAEPFWSSVVVGGQPRDVLIQAFERRVLTYTPSNPDSFQVEMGNIGQHYYQWRYRDPAAAPPGAATAVPSSSPSGTAATSPAPSTTAAPGSSALAVAFAGAPTSVTTGGLVTASVTTRGGASCTLNLRAPSARDPARSLAFGTKTAGADGRVSWTSALPLDTKVGAWPLEATCASGGQSGSASTTVTVQAGVGGA